MGPNCLNNAALIHCCFVDSKAMNQRLDSHSTTESMYVVQLQYIQYMYSLLLSGHTTPKKYRKDTQEDCVIKNVSGGGGMYVSIKINV